MRSRRCWSPGLVREVALRTMLGGLVRLEPDDLGESSNSVVRESVTSALQPACESAGVAPFTDDDVNEVALLLSLRSLRGLAHGYLRAMADTRRAADTSVLAGAD